MPVQHCQSDGKPGWRWGQSGKCYVYTPGSEASSNEAKRRAHVQGAAITKRGGKALDDGWADDPQMWQDIRAALLPRVYAQFREAFLIGAEMGAMQQPSRARVDETQVDIGERQIDNDQQTVLPYDFEAILTASDEVVGGYTDAWWQQFAASTQRQMRRSIERAISFGMTPDQLAAELAPLFGPVRAQTIAVSELTNLMGMGAQETYRRAGYGFWEWRTVRDSLVDEDCTRRDRRHYRMSTPFRRAHVNCRCWPVPAGKPAIQPRLFGLSA